MQNAPPGPFLFISLLSSYRLSPSKPICYCDFYFEKRFVCVERLMYDERQVYMVHGACLRSGCTFTERKTLSSTPKPNWLLVRTETFESFFDYLIKCQENIIKKLNCINFINFIMSSNFNFKTCPFLAQI